MIRNVNAINIYIFNLEAPKEEMYGVKINQHSKSSTSLEMLHSIDLILYMEMLSVKTL